MAIADHSDVEAASGKTFNGNSTPTDGDVDNYCIEAEAQLNGMVGFDIDEVTETEEMYSPRHAGRALLVKFPITELTKLEERQGTSYTTLTEGPLEDYIYEAETGIIRATSLFGGFEAGPERYRVTYKHGILSTDGRYTMAKEAIVKMAMIAVITAEAAGDGRENTASFSVGGLSVSYSDQDRTNLAQRVVDLVRAIRGEWRPINVQG